MAWARSLDFTGATNKPTCFPMLAFASGCLRLERKILHLDGCFFFPAVSKIFQGEYSWNIESFALDISAIKILFQVHWIFTKSNVPKRGFLSNLPIFLSVCPGARDAWQDQTASHHNPSFEGPLLRKDHKSQMFFWGFGCLNKWTPKQNGHQEFQVPKNGGILNLVRLFWGWDFPYLSLT